MIGLHVLPFMPRRLGGTPGPPSRLGLGALGVDTSLCAHTETHTKCVNGQTVSLSCTANRYCATGVLHDTNCWNDETCPASSGGGGGGGGGGASSVPAPSAADGWTKCADENHTCDWPGAGVADVRYGAGAKWLEKDSITDKIGCSNGVFGDANPGTYKACWYKLQTPATATPTPPVSSVPPPGQQTTPGEETAPPTPMQECDAPSSPTLDYTERWVQVDPVKCLWQIIRTATPGQPVALPNVYTGTASIIIPQSAPPSETPLSPGAVGLYQPSTQIGGSVEVTDAEITQAFLDVLGVGPTPDQLTTAENQHFANIADLYTYVHTLQAGGDTTGTGLLGGGAPSFLTDHPYVTLGVAALGAWLLFGGRRR
jgi:hypothetical protein